jgi:hypothetical protein
MALNLRLRIAPADEDILSLSRENPGYQFRPDGERGTRRDPDRK